MPGRRSATILATCTLVLSACHHSGTSAGLECPPFGVASLTGAALQPAQLRAADRALGRIVFDVRGGTNEAPLVPTATIRLFTDTLARDPRAATRIVYTDRSGMAVIDSLPPGRYGLLVRTLGYYPLQGVLSIRAGASDTVQVRLRGQPACLT